MMKQLEEKEVYIEDKKYMITPMPAMKAAYISARLFQILVPIAKAAGPFLNQIMRSGDGMNFDLSDIDFTEAMSNIDLATLKPDDVTWLIQNLLLAGNIRVDNVTKNDGSIGRAPLDQDLFNELFCMDIFSMYQLMWEVIKINFSGFLPKARRLFGEATTAAAGMTQETETAPEKAPTRHKIS